ncbi:MAG: substrate-binding domain-containing protein [Kiritimatiellae bacterium]|nr:substrate-binding domain-containing protein [Kiritimatiellia bacterium]
MKKKKVFIALKMSGIAGQEKLAGIFRYLKEEYADSIPWEIQLVRTQGELTQGTVERAISGGADGFIVSIPDTEDAVIPLADMTTPTIIMDIHSSALAKRKTNIAFIRNSADEIGSEAAHFLLRQGISRSYAFLHSAPITDWSRARFESFKRTLNDNGHWCEEISDPAAIAKLKRPVAVLAANDDIAFDAIKTLSAKRIRIPKDIAILGVDNDTLICENAQPRLSSVQPDFGKEGHLAAEILDQMMNGAETSSRTVLVGVTRIVQRESTAEQSHAGLLVQKALAYIDRHALEGIGVNDVVQHLNCSRRLADLRFRELQGTSIMQTIIEKRLDEVRRKLAGTKEKIDAIASACGFDNSNYLKNLFKKRFGMSMREFRNGTNPSNPYLFKSIRPDENEVLAPLR